MRHNNDRIQLIAPAGGGTTSAPLSRTWAKSPSVDVRENGGSGRLLERERHALSISDLSAAKSTSKTRARNPASPVPKRGMWLGIGEFSRLKTNEERADKNYSFENLC